MPTSFFQYEMLPTTWFYVSSLIILAVFFKFNRFWSVRNLDLIGLILFTPGLLRLAMHDDQWGYAWIFAIGVLVVIRLIFDTLMVRRPLLEPNLTPGGLTFSCFFLVSFVIAALLVNRGDQIDTIRTVRLEQILTTRHLEKGIGMNPATLTIPKEERDKLQPGFLPFLAMAERTNLLLAPSSKIRAEISQASEVTATPRSGAFLSERPGHPGVDDTHFKSFSPALVSPNGGSPSIPPQPLLLSENIDRQDDKPAPTESGSIPIFLRPIPPFGLGQLFLIMSTTILGHLAIVFALIHIGHCHFGNIRTGIACATLYLLHPYTNQMVGRLDHLIPAALILWAVAMYRRPFFSGLWIGTAAALVFYPIVLVPLWLSFYWRRGWVRFVIGIGSALVFFALALLFSPSSLGGYGSQLLHLCGKSSLGIFTQADGFWNYYEIMIYRVPIMAIFFVLCFGMILWPTHKHLATLLSCSTLLLLGVQFWQLHQGGLYMAWYLPLLILTIFRPNLEDRVAQSTVVL